jgi:hypothetical protein
VFTSFFVAIIYFIIDILNYKNYMIMLLSKKLYGLFFILLMSASVVFAQVPQQMPQQQTTEVSDDEIEQFALAFVEVQNIEQKVQPEMIQAVEEEGIEVQRFNEIMNAQQDPNQEVDASEDELKKFASANREIEDIQNRAQREMMGKITKSGLTVERYQEIMTAVRNDPALQQKLQSSMQEE